MNDDKKKNIVSSQGIMASRGERRLNEMFARMIDLKNDSIKHQAKSIQAMNGVFTQLAEKLGTPIPGAAVDGPTCLRLMVERIEALLDKEKRMDALLEMEKSAEE